MKVNTAVKRYWARTGNNETFGYDSDHRREMIAEEAENRWDKVWPKKIKPALDAGRTIPADHARKMLPSDKRQKHFDDTKTHRAFRMGRQTVLAQIDEDEQELEQVWHTNPKSEGDYAAEPPPLLEDPVVKLQKATGMERRELVKAVGKLVMEEV